MGQINTNNYPTVNSLLDADLLIVENATNGTGTTTPKQLRENAIGTDTLQTSAQTVTGAINELKHEIDLGAGVVRYDVNTITSGYLGQFSGSANLLLLHLTTDGTADATNGYMMMLSYSRPVARFAYGRLVDSDGVAYKQDVYADNTIICTISGSGEGTESDPEQVVILGIINAGFMLTPTAVVSDRDIIDGQGNTLSVLAEALTKTASGNPVVITDCAGGKARSLITSINAIQDLHGYDHPWVGGAYKNLVELYMTNREVNGVTYTKNSDGSFTLNGTATGNINFRVDQDNTGSVVNPKTWAAGTYAMSKSTTKFRLVVMQDSSFTTIMSLEANDTSNTVTIADTVNNCFTFIAISTGTRFDNEKFYIQIEKGNQATSWTPWENICPISGRDSVVVDDSNKNLLHVTAQSTTASGVTITVYDDGTVKLNGTATAQIIFVLNTFTFLNGVSYTLNGAPTGSEFGKYFLSCVIGADYGNGATFTGDGLTNNVRIVVQNGITCNNIIFKPMIRLATETDPTFVPYAHSSATIQLGTTVYGADINWDTGVMTVTDAIVDMGSLLWDRQSQYNRFISEGIATTVKKPTSGAADAISSCYRAVEAPDVQNNDGTFGVSGSSGNLFVRDDRYNNATAFATAIAGQTICYKLATPTTIQLTPTQLEMLKGYNRVSIDNGSIELGYIAKLT